MFEKFKMNRLEKQYPILAELRQKENDKNYYFKNMRWAQKMLYETNYKKTFASAHDIEQLTKEASNIRLLISDLSSNLNHAFVDYNEIMFQARKIVEKEILEKYLKLLDKQPTLWYNINTKKERSKKYDNFWKKNYWTKSWI